MTQIELRGHYQIVKDQILRPLVTRVPNSRAKYLSELFAAVNRQDENISHRILTWRFAHKTLVPRGKVIAERIEIHSAQIH